MVFAGAKGIGFELLKVGVNANFSSEVTNL